MSNALDKSSTGIFNFSNFDQALKYAELILRSSFAPKSYKSAADVLIAVAYGAEVGLKPMQALQSIAVINGKPSLYGDAMLALVRNSGLLESIMEWIDGDTAYCELVRCGNDPRVFSFSKAEAKAAGLLGKAGPWTSYPNRMLMFRARGFGLRDCFGDVLGGLITIEEAMDYPSDKKPKAVKEMPSPEALENKDSQWIIDQLSDSMENGQLIEEDYQIILDRFKVHSLSSIPLDDNERLNKVWQWVQPRLVGSSSIHKEIIVGSKCEDQNGNVVMPGIYKTEYK